MGQFPPAELKPLGLLGARIASIAWWLLFAIAVTGPAMDIWNAIANHRADAAFGRLGAQAYFSRPNQCTAIAPAAAAAFETWPAAMRGPGCILAIGDAPVVPGAMPRDLTSLLAGADGAAVQLTIRGKNGQRHAWVLTRQESNLAEARPAAPAWSGLGQIAAFALVGLTLAFTALMLRLRRPGDPVSILIAFAFVLMANVGFGDSSLWTWTGHPRIGAFSLAAGQTLLVIAFAAFPNGVFLPRFSRWLVLIAPVALLGAMAANQLWPANHVIIGFLRFSLVLVPLIGAVLLQWRYRSLPPGLERQQARWAVFGLVAGLPLIAITAPFTPEQMGLFAIGDPRFLWLAMAYVVATILGYALLAIGIGISLLRYRLNDADAVMSKSLTYTILALAIPVAFGIIDAVTKAYLGQFFDNSILVGAIMATLAVLVITPSRTKLLGWAEKRFQQALVRLRALPVKLTIWQASETPEELGQAALDMIAEGVRASEAALLGSEAEGAALIAAVRTEEIGLRGRLAAERPLERRDDPFPIRVPLADGIDEQGLLVIGRRSDGASYTRDERSAIASVTQPLTQALRAAGRRDRQTAALAAALTEALGTLEQRLEALEQSRKGRRRKAES